MGSALKGSCMDRTVTPETKTGLRTGFGVVSIIALVLLIVGGLNWALVGLFNVDLVAAIFGTMSTMSRIVYVLVGVAAV
jgi:uncharacterized protein